MNIVPSGGSAALQVDVKALLYPNYNANQTNIAQSTTEDSTTTTIEPLTNTLSPNVLVVVKISQGNATSYNSVQNGTAVHAAPRFTADMNASRVNSSAGKPTEQVQKPTQGKWDNTILYAAMGIILASLAITVSYSVVRRRLLIALQENN